MKEYTVVQIVCEKETKAYDIYTAVKDTVKFNRNLFELSGLFKHKDKVSSKKNQKFESLDLQRFYHVKVLEHLRKSPYYDPEKNDVRLFSNLDNAWDWNNKEVTDSIDSAVFEEMIKFADGLKLSEVSTILLGIDEIEWDGNKVGHGTYGYEKAKSTHHGGENYLSNSIIIFKAPYEHKPYTVYLSCEKRFRELDSVNGIIKTIGGKIRYEQTYFAPENEVERKEWERAYAEAEMKIKAIETKLPDIMNNMPEETKEYQEYQQGVKNNVRKIIKQVLCTDGWEQKKNTVFTGVGTMVIKDKDDSDVAIIIDSLHGGQHLQTLIFYVNPKFKVGLHTNYICNAINEEEVAKYLKNVKYIADYVYQAL